MTGIECPREQLLQFHCFNAQRKHHLCCDQVCKATLYSHDLQSIVIRRLCLIVDHGNQNPSLNTVITNSILQHTNAEPSTINNARLAILSLSDSKEAFKYGGSSKTENSIVAVSRVSMCSSFLKGQYRRPLACIPHRSHQLFASCGGTLSVISTQGRKLQSLVSDEKTTNCTLDISQRSQTTRNDMGSSSEESKCTPSRRGPSLEHISKVR